jgi:DNA-binding response OmpR family regulator
MTETLLVVDPDEAARRDMVNTLRAGRYQAITADGFPLASQLLESSRPDLLITVARLGTHNGLHLVVIGRAANPRLSALVVDDRHDTVLQRDALNAGATAYLVRPLRPTEFLRYVAEALVSRERRIWRRMPLAADVIIGIGAGHARLLDIGYGGFRVESITMHIHHELKLDLPILGLSLKARRVWSRQTDVATVWSCGAAIVAPSDSPSTQRWRRLVDTVRAGSSFDS